jgi:hypothetical protein
LVTGFLVLEREIQKNRYSFELIKYLHFPILEKKEDSETRDAERPCVGHLVGLLA